MQKPVVLVIMDGFGIRDELEGNAIKQANTPNLDKLFSEWPFTTLHASGKAVGLPEGFIGSSEVGHLNIGAGRLVPQEQVIVDNAIAGGFFYKNKVLIDVIKKGKNVHLMGLLSDQGVHAHINHLFALMKVCKQHGVKPFIHVITDGRDTLPRSCGKYLEMLDEAIAECGGEIKTIVGRYYSMDRNNNWDRTKLAYDAINSGFGEKVISWREAISNSYDANEEDEFIKPKIINYSGLENGDSVIFFNLRSDRPRQLTQALVEEDFDKFERRFKKINFVPMVKYYTDLKTPVLCEKPHPDMGLGELFSSLGLKQYRIAETEKYAHVTYFFSGEREHAYPGEERIMIPSPDVATYDEKPEMSAYEITDKALEVLYQADLAVINFANCDMIGHTGYLDHTIKAVEAVDDCVGRIYERVMELQGLFVVTADHGNAETMRTGEGDTITSHSLTKVPLCIAGWKKDHELKHGKLGDIAPTILTIIGIEVPKQMTGDILV